MRQRTASWVAASALGVLGLVGCGDEATTSGPGSAAASGAGSGGKAGAAAGGNAGAGLAGKAGAGAGQAGSGGASGGSAGQTNGGQGGGAGSGGAAGAGNTGGSGTAGASAGTGGASAGAAGVSGGGTAGASGGGTAGASAGGTAGASAGGTAGASAGGTAGASAGGTAGASAGAGGNGAGGAGGGKVFSCTEAADCPGPGSVCDPVLRACVAFATCGSCDSGFTCEKQGTSLTKACYLECDRASNDCPGGMICTGCTSPDDCFGFTCRYPGGAARGAPCEHSATLSGCADGLVCIGLVEPVCLAPCDFASAAPNCPSGESCHPDDVCRPTATTDPAAIDAECGPGGGSTFGPTMCAAAGGKVRGACDLDAASEERCRAFCATDNDCGSGKICVESGAVNLAFFSLCVPDPVGRACNDAEECTDPQRFVCDPGSRTCQRPCDETSPCAGGAFCSTRLADLAVCHATCVLGGTGCPAGSACLPIDGSVTVGTCKTLGAQTVGEFCAPRDGASECGADARCVGFVCRRPCDYWGGGAACEAGEVCAPDGVCLAATDVDDAKIGGFCDPTAFPAPADIACGGVTGVRANGRCLRSRCEKPCRSGKNDCAAGESCFLRGVGEELGACYPDSLGSTCASDQDCQEGDAQTCDPTTKKCIAYACNQTTCLTNRCVPDESGQIACDESCQLGDPPSVCGPTAVCASIDLAGIGACVVKGTSALGAPCDDSQGTTGCTGDLVCTEDAAGDSTCQPRCDGFAASANACGPDARCAPALGACVKLRAGYDRPALGDSCESGPSEPSFCGDDGKTFRGLCASTGKYPSCQPVCRTNADCSSGFACVGEVAGSVGVCL